MADNIEGYWRGWLIENMGSEKITVLGAIEQAINDKHIPMYGNRNKDQSVQVKNGTVNMWWRNDTPELTITSEMDGKVEASVATQDYGTSLWVHVWLERKNENMGHGDNWAKAMHWSAFQQTLELVVKEALENISAENRVLDVFNPKGNDTM